MGPFNWAVIKVNCLSTYHYLTIFKGKIGFKAIILTFVLLKIRISNLNVFLPVV